MSEPFFNEPVLNSPYGYPEEHWNLNEDGQPTDLKISERRPSKLITPVPKPKKRRSKESQPELELDTTDGLSSAKQEYTLKPIVNDIRRQVDEWRKLSSADQWGVTSQTARLLQHWRHHDFQGIRPFFCQVEAVETAIWLAEVAPKSSARGKPVWRHLEAANQASNPDLFRIALKLATGAGKTTVMAMLIAWQTVNAARQPDSRRYSKGFLIVAPGITIRDRLRVLLPNDSESYYRHRELVPSDMLNDINSAKIVITNYHAFKRRDTFQAASGTRRLAQGRGSELKTLETEGQMLQRVAGDLLGMNNVTVINDEAHHCYRERPDTEEEKTLKGEEKEEAKKNNEAARLWISGLEALKRKKKLGTVYDLSATPFFLRGSGYIEGTLFPWVVSDFSLMDAIESGIVKLPRVPVAQNIPMGDMPMYRELWDHIGKKMPKKGRGKGGAAVDPHKLPTQLQTALDALYGHYEKTFELWQEAKIDVPPVFIVVCNNTATSKLVFDYISGFRQQHEDGNETFHEGRLELFRNFDQHGNPLPRPNTLLIDSEQLESGEALDKSFRDIASDEIDQFKREIVDRSGDQRAADSLSDADILREVMNTVGKPGRLGASIRCVVSVSMLTEGWDANTVTHILGVRAFGTQLLCEQVVGRGLRRQSYELNENGLFNVEYADVLGIPFDFTAAPVVSKPVRPKPTVRVHALSPERDHLEIRFPRVEGYRTELPKERLDAAFTDQHRLELTPELVGPTITRNQGLIGEAVNLTVEHLADVRKSSAILLLATYLLQHHYRDPGEPPNFTLFGEMRRVAKRWLDECFTCRGDTNIGQLFYREITEMAANRIMDAITKTTVEDGRIKAILDPYNPTGSTSHVSFTTSKESRWDTAGPPPKCHLNWIMLDSDWEAEFCRVAERHPRVTTYVKNHALGFEIPYRRGSQPRKYLPGLHPQDRRRPRRERPAQPHRRDLRLSQGRQAGQGRHGPDLLAPRHQCARHLRPLGVRRIYRRLRDRESFLEADRQLPRQGRRMTAFGTLRQLDARTAWRHEAHDFTPWLCDNLDRLAETIGIPLELVNREVRVETYAADILARCPADDSIVLIENQLGEGDHSHLGQLLTYLAGLDAQTVIWIAPAFRTAHLSAIRWLNQHTADGFSFFAIRLKVLRIDDSPLAPVFEIAEQPNAWDRQLRQIVREQPGMTELGQFRRRFWRHYFTRHPSEGEPAAAGGASSIWQPIEAIDAVLALFVSKDGLGVFVRPDRSGDGADLALRLAPHADRLREQLGVQLADKPNYLLLTKHAADMTDESGWDQAADWLRDTAVRYRTTLRDLLQD